MGLLKEILKDLTENGSLVTALLKTQVLASRLDSEVLEDWVKHEVQGYPIEVEVPEYRVAKIYYDGDFTDGFVTYPSQPVPVSAVTALVGKSWSEYRIRVGMHGIETALSRNSQTKKMQLSNGPELQQRIGSQIFENLECLRLNAVIPSTAFDNVDGMVRANLLSFLLAVEKQFPEVSGITLDNNPDPSKDLKEGVTRNFYQIIYGNVGVASADNLIAHSINVVTGDKISLSNALQKLGLSTEDANELVEIVAEDGPQSASNPLSKRVKEWLQRKGSVIADGTWSVSLDVGKELIKEAIKSYFGM